LDYILNICNFKEYLILKNNSIFIIFDIFGKILYNNNNLILSLDEQILIENCKYILYKISYFNITTNFKYILSKKEFKKILIKQKIQKYATQIFLTS